MIHSGLIFGENIQANFTLGEPLRLKFQGSTSEGCQWNIPNNDDSKILKPNSTSQNYNDEKQDIDR